MNRTSSFLKINRNNIYGCEIESDTTKYALASLLVNNNSLKINILNKCSLTNNNYLFEDNKFDLILTNPPFGTKMIYKNLETRFNDYKTNYYKSSQLKFNDIYPINTNNGACLFIQHVIYMLKEGGICGIVLPDGNELASKGYYNIRKFLIDNCKIIKIINVSGGTFSSTGVKTKVIIFKKQKGIDNHKNIDFLEINKNCDELKLITTTDLDKNYSFRLKINQDFIFKRDEYEIKTLGEICEIIKGPKKRSKDAKEKGLYPLYYCSIIGNLYLDTFDYTDEGIIINKTNGSGKTMIYYGTKNYNVGETTIHFKSKLSNIKTRYIYYYLLYNKSILECYYYGLNQQSITDDDLFKIEIPIPSIEIQNKKVEELDKLEASIETINLRTEQIKHEQNYILNSIISTECDDIEYKTLGEVSNIENGKRIVKDQVETGEYPVLGGGGFTSFYTNNYTREGKTCKISREGMSLHNCVMILNQKYYLNSQAFTIISNNPNLINDYLWYYLDSIKEQIFNCGRGTAQKAIDIEEFNLMKIPIPSIEKQKEIVDILDGINNRINEDIKYIEYLRKLISESISKSISKSI